MSKHHVVPRGERWAVKGEGKARASAVFETQAEAIRAAKKIAANQGGYVLIHRRDGTIRTEKVERIAGTIKVEVASDESLTVVQRKIARANKRLKVLSAKVATKKKARDKKAAAPRKATVKKAAPRKTAAKKAAPRKAAAKKAAPRKAAAKRPAKKAAPKRAASKRTTSKKPAAKKAPKKMVGGKGLKVILSSASKAVRKLVSK